MKTVAAGGQRLMSRGAALRAFAGLGLGAALALLAAGCIFAEMGYPEVRLDHAEVTEYDGEVLTVRADLENDHQRGALVDLYLAQVGAMHSEPCFDEYGRGGCEDAESARIVSGSYGFRWGGPTPMEYSMLVEEGTLPNISTSIAWRCRVKDAMLDGCTGRYLERPRYRELPEPLERQDVGFDFTELSRGDRWAEMTPGDEVQVLFRFRLPGLTPGDTVAFHYGGVQSIELVVG